MESKLVWKKILPNRYVIINKTIQVSCDLFSRARNPSDFSYIFSLDLNFENVTTEFYVLYIFYMHVKFRLNRIIFRIRSIKLFFIYNFKSQKT